MADGDGDGAGVAGGTCPGIGANGSTRPPPAALSGAPYRERLRSVALLCGSSSTCGTVALAGGTWASAFLLKYHRVPYVEVATTTLDFDLGVKADLYAGAGVPEYWVVDVNENRVLMHANPRPDGSGYDGQLDVPFGAPLHAATIEGLTVESAGLA